MDWKIYMEFFTVYSLFHLLKNYTIYMYHKIVPYPGGAKKVDVFWSFEWWQCHSKRHKQSAFYPCALWVQKSFEWTALFLIFIDRLLSTESNFDIRIRMICNLYLYVIGESQIYLFLVSLVDLLSLELQLVLEVQVRRLHRGFLETLEVQPYLLLYQNCK